jgi:hypothetical protein
VAHLPQKSSAQALHFFIWCLEVGAWKLELEEQGVGTFNAAKRANLNVKALKKSLMKTCFH